MEAGATEAAGVVPVASGRAKPPTAAKLTDRDRDILGLLVLARYLTAAQVHRLAFDGKNLSLAYRRLLKLSKENGQPAFVEQRFFRTYDGNRVAVWAPTPHAMPAAVRRAGGELPELPKHEVGAQFLEHLVQLNELLVVLWWTSSRCPKAVHPALRWIPSDRVRLPWGEYEMREGRVQQRVIQPDAVLELPGQRRRYFLECEMGTQPLSPGPGNAQGATLSKAERYHAFLTTFSGAGFRDTYYSVQYPDGFSPEVLFLVLTPGRASSVNAVLSTWGEKAMGPRRSSMRALTFEAAATELRKLAGLPALPPRGPDKAPRTPAVVRAAATLTPAEVVLLRQCLWEWVVSLKRARAVFRELQRADLPPYPKSYDAVRDLLERMSATGSP